MAEEHRADYARPTRRDHQAARIRRTFQPQIEQFEGSDPELAARFRSLRDTVLRSIDGTARPSSGGGYRGVGLPGP